MNKISTNSKIKYNNISGFANTNEVKRRQVKIQYLADGGYDDDVLNEKKKVCIFGTWTSEPAT